MKVSRLSVSDVTVSFGGLRALEKVNLELDDNQLLGFIGPNGAGKTTLMRVIMGLIRPQSGTVCLNGTDITKLPTGAASPCRSGTRPADCQTATSDVAS